MTDAEAIGMTKMLDDFEAWLPNVAQMLDEMKVEREQAGGLPWTTWNQEQRDAVGRLITAVQAAKITRRIMSAPIPSSEDEGLVEKAQSSIEELDYIARYETTPIVVGQAALRAKDVISTLSSREAVLRKALEFYGDRETWASGRLVCGHHGPSVASQDAGHVARQALSTDGGRDG